MLRANRVERAVACTLVLLGTSCGGRSALGDGFSSSLTEGGPGAPDGQSDAHGEAPCIGCADSSTAADAGDVASPDAGPADSGCDSCSPPAASIAVLFGGLDSSSTTRGDTWEWDGRAWAERAADAGPPARRSHAMAALGGKVVLFGGLNDTAFFGDTWEWDGVAWTDKTPRAGPSPSARDLHAMATLSGKVVLYGGHLLVAPDGGSVATGGSERAFLDTWEWDGTSWTERQGQASSAPTPSVRTDLAMAPLASVAVLFGGFPLAAGAAYGDTWTWSDAAGWASPSLPVSPPARYGQGMSTLGGKVVLFGGFNGYTTYLGDTWTWNGAAWSKAATTGPGARVSGSMATRVGSVVLFGGFDGAKALSDTWEWDGVAWAPRTGAQGPSARQLAAMAAR